MPTFARRSLAVAVLAAASAIVAAAGGRALARDARTHAPLDAPIGPVGRPTTGGPTQAELDGADDSRSDWPMYAKGYRAERYSALTQIDRFDVANLHRVCALPLGERATFTTGPVEYDGLLYVTTHLDTYALDATTCALRWHDHHAARGPESRATNKGVALAGGRVVRGTQDGYLFALDAKTGRRLWLRRVADARLGEGIAAAPLAWHGLVFVGLAGGDDGIRGRMMAFRAADGSLAWRTDLLDAGGKHARSWEPPSSISHGGGGSWTSYALDVRTATLFVPVGNPAPAFDRDVRDGANLHASSVVALHADDGTLAWAAQQRPNDFHDYDTTGVALFDAGGAPEVAVTGKGGRLDVYRRDNGTPVFGLAMTTLRDQTAPLVAAGTRVCPSAGVQWNGAAHDATTGLLYVNAIDWCATYEAGSPPVWRPGRPYLGLRNGFGTPDPIARASGWVNAVDPATGTMRWRDRMPAPMYAGIAATASGLLFTGDLQGNLLALDARDGKLLYRAPTGAGPVAGGVITYERDGRQFVAVAAGNDGGSIPLPGRPTVVLYAL